MRVHIEKKPHSFCVTIFGGAGATQAQEKPPAPVILVSPLGQLL